MNGCFTIQHVDLPSAKGLETFLRFSEPRAVHRLLFRRIKALPEGVNHLRLFKGRELQCFFGENRAFHVFIVARHKRKIKMVK
jgi:hypothetical protein